MDRDDPEYATFTRHHPELPDLVWLYKANDSDELRYSIRSITANLPHRSVWIVGDKPDWYTGRHLPFDVHGDLHLATFAQLRLACETDAISDPFILVNDDMFLTEPVTDLPNHHLGTVESVVLANKANRIRGGYAMTIATTGTYLESIGYSDPLCYELHVPMTIHKAPMLEALDHCERHAAQVDHGSRRWLNKRTMYGNLAGIGGEQIDDVKVSRRLQDRPNATWLSTNENTFRRFREELAEMFPHPSEVEQ